MKTWQHYFWLTKPGIIAGNSIALIGGYLLASKGHIAFWRLLATMTGTAIVIGGSCVINNYLDRGLDAKMARTKWRAASTKAISVPLASLYAGGLMLGGLGMLAIWVNWLTVAVGLAGAVTYIVLYGYMKRHSIHGTLVGCVSGAMPPVAGYTAASNRTDTAALLLLLMLTFWQLAHFYAIAMYRFKDYQQAGLPVLPVVKGADRARYYVLANIVAFLIAGAALTGFGYTGYIFLSVIIVLTILWLRRGIRSFNSLSTAKWGQSMFRFSLIVMLGLSVGLSVGSILV